MVDIGAALRSASCPAPEGPLSGKAERQAGRGRILEAVFATLDRARLPYCVLHGYQDYPAQVRSDLDCIVSAEIPPARLAGLFLESSDIDADLVRSRGHHLVLVSRDREAPPCYLTLDFSVDYELEDRLYCSGKEILEGRRRYRQFWVPAADLEFGCYLARKIVKRDLSSEQTGRLRELYRRDPIGCRHAVERFWSGKNATLIILAAITGDWQPVRQRLEELRRQLRRRATLRHPWLLIRNRMRGLAGKAARYWRPDAGLDVVFLGPDGAGKSTVISALKESLAGAFAHTACYSFPPGLRDRLLRRPQRLDPSPHGTPSRSFLASALRAILYWFPYERIGYYATVRPALARSSLVMRDRDLVDTLVDPRRYRYSGPASLLRLICRLAPKPDLVMLLDAPPEVLRARKQEVSPEETSRQREAYLALIRSLPNGYVVDARQPLPHVVRDVSDIILRHVIARVARRVRRGNRAGGSRETKDAASVGVGGPK